MTLKFAIKRKEPIKIKNKNNQDAHKYSPYNIHIFIQQYPLYHHKRKIQQRRSPNVHCLLPSKLSRRETRAAKQKIFSIPPPPIIDRRPFRRLLPHTCAESPTRSLTHTHNPANGKTLTKAKKVAADPLLSFYTFPPP